MARKEKVGERDAFVLTFEPTAGSPIRQYIDAETYMPMRTMLTTDMPQMGEIEQTVDPSDFRDVDGVKVPFKLRLTNRACRASR